GKTNEETFFKFDPMSEEDREKALEKANRKIVELQAEGLRSDARPHLCCAIVIDRTSVAENVCANWKGDRWFVYPLFTAGYKDVVKPKLRELGIAYGQYWVHIAFTPDPAGPRKREDGTERQELVAYPDVVYPSEEEAKKAMYNSGASPQQSVNMEHIPDGYTQQSWNSIKPYIKKELADGKPIPEIAKSYAVQIEDVIRLKESA
ncbi:MAG: hypothetical protein HPY87_10085, partial [Fervidobacterium sp.]|uniref:hypothetical protein n=1 Tax=Fervidobacterium sp. TaxID=1871331 RepID=UPI0025C2D27C